MKICSKCETIVLGDTVKECPNCDESFSSYQSLRVDLGLEEL